jgi:TPR repeat protein
MALRHRLELPSPNDPCSAVRRSASPSRRCGRMLAEGRGGSLDLRAARAWFLQAAEQANADAEVATGEMLIKRPRRAAGQGFGDDVVRACRRRPSRRIACS